MSLIPFIRKIIYWKEVTEEMSLKRDPVNADSVSITMREGALCLFVCFLFPARPSSFVAHLSTSRTRRRNKHGQNAVGGVKRQKFARQGSLERDTHRADETEHVLHAARYCSRGPTSSIIILKVLFTFRDLAVPCSFLRPIILLLSCPKLLFSSLITVQVIQPSSHRRDQSFFIFVIRSIFQIK